MPSNQQRTPRQRSPQQRGLARRDQLLDCAEALFFQKGYEAASIQDLMQAAGVSKGAVYHHFRSKEEVLEAISVRLAAAAAASVAPIVEDGAIGAVDKLNRILEALRRRKASEWPRFQGAFETLLSPGAVILFHQVHQATSRVMSPLFAEVLQAGIREGAFRITDARAVAEMILHLEGSLHTVIEEAASAEGGATGVVGAALVQRRVGQIGIAIDRLLGLPDHTIDFAGSPAGETLPPEL